MAFQLIPPPSFNVNIPPQPDALQKFGQMASLRDMLAQSESRQQLLPGQIQEQQARVQQQQVETQRAQIQLESQKAMMAMIASGELNKYAGVTTDDGSGFDAAGAFQHMMSTGKILPEQASAFISPIQNIAKNQAEIYKDTSQAGEAQAALREKGRKVLTESMGSVLDAPSSDFAKTRDAFRNQLVNSPDKFAGVPRQDLALAYSSADTPEHFAAAVGALGLESQLADFHKSKSSAAAEKQKLIPEGGGISPEGQQKIAQDVAVASNPAIQQGKVDVAKAEGEARANIEAQTARGSNAALANVPPHLVAPATQEATKLGVDYATFTGQVANLRKLISGAKTGDEVASAFAPVAVALGSNAFYGTHRLAPAEVQAMGPGVGSIGRQLNTWFDKHATGTISPDTLNEFNNIVDRLESSKKDAYNTSLGIVNQNYGANFKPVSSTPSTSPTATHTPGGQAQGLAEGQTGTGSNGKKYVVKGGVWQPQ